MPAPDRRRRLTAFVVAMAVLIVTPLAVVAADTFTDVPDSNVHHDDITWLADAGVTLGCNPPTNDEFCPGDPVLRQQMASFLRRLAENQVVDAATAIQADNATTADTAGDTDMLGGAEPTAYESRRATDSCGLEILPGPTLATTCLPSTSGALPEGVSTEVLGVNLQVPTTGAVETHLTATTDGILWFSLNEACAPLGATGEAIFNQAINGHLYGLDGDESIENAGTVGFNAPPGDHTVRLCAISTATGGGSVIISSLVAEWSQGGSVQVASDTASPVPASLAEEVLGGFEN